MPDVTYVLNAADEDEHCGIYLRDNVFYIHSVVGTKEGLYRTWRPYFATPSITSDALLGKLIRIALRESNLKGWEPSTPKAMEVGPLHRLAGAQSWRAFERGARCLAVRKCEGVVTLSPSRQRARGYAYSSKKARTVAASVTDSELGREARATIELSELRGHG